MFIKVVFNIFIKFYTSHTVLSPEYCDHSMKKCPLPKTPAPIVLFLAALIFVFRNLASLDLSYKCSYSGYGPFVRVSVAV